MTFKGPITYITYITYSNILNTEVYRTFKVIIPQMRTIT